MPERQSVPALWPCPPISSISQYLPVSPSISPHFSPTPPTNFPPRRDGNANRRVNLRRLKLIHSTPISLTFETFAIPHWLQTVFSHTHTPHHSYPTSSSTITIPLHFTSLEFIIFHLSFNAFVPSHNSYFYCFKYYH